MQINLKSLALLGGMFLSIFSYQNSLHSTWEPPVVLNNPLFPAILETGPVLKVNPQGNAIAIWTDFVSGDLDPFFDARISSAFYNRGVGWLPPQVISSLQTSFRGEPLYSDQGDPDIALNSSNYAVAVWEASYNAAPNFPLVVVATTRDPNTGIWAPVTILSDQSGNLIGDNINVSLNEAGTALAAWHYRTDAGPQFIAVSFLPLGGTWTPEFDFPQYPGTPGDGKPYPVINPSGNAVVTWEGRLNNGDATVTVSTYSAATNTWAPQVILDSGSIGNFSEDPRCAMDSNGNAVAIWNNNGNVNTSYFNGTSWGPIVTIGTTAGDVSFSLDGPEVVMDPMGNVTATWTSMAHTILSAFRLPNGTWSAPQTISAPSAFDQQFDPNQSHETLAVNPVGDLMAIWAVVSGNTPIAIESAFKPFGQPWRSPEIVFTGEFDPLTLNVGLALCGFAVSAWEAPLTDFLVMAAVNENLLLPMGTVQTRCCEVFATQKVCLNFLSWTPDPCVLLYNIYRDGVFIGSVLNTGGALTFTDPVGCNKNSIYTIAAVNFFGFEGGRVPFTFL